MVKDDTEENDIKKRFQQDDDFELHNLNDSQEIQQLDLKLKLSDHQNSEDDQSINEKLKCFIGSIKQAPQFIQDKYILSGYRINFTKKREIIKSLFMKHNETMNVWTHLIGLIIVLILIVYITYGMKINPAVLKKHYQNDLQNYIRPIIKDLQDFEKNHINSFTQNFHALKQNYLIPYQEKMQNIFLDLETRLVDIKKEKYQWVQEQVIQMRKQSQIYYDSLANSTASASLMRDQQLQNMVLKIEELQKRLSDQIQMSSDLDWVDIYNHLPQEKKVRSRHYDQITKVPVLAFLVTGTLCLMFSATFHLFCALNLKTYKWLIRLDYAGITLLITGSTAPLYVYGFYCQPNQIGFFYFKCLTVASTLVFIVTLFDFMHQLSWIRFKGMMFASLGIGAGLPIIHLYQVDYKFIHMALPWYLGLGFFYLLGLSIYLKRWPEIKYPFIYDIFGSSHQIWHICVLLGLFVTYFGSLRLLYYRSENQCTY